MQSGKIKHWNQEKGYGFIDVDNQSEDVFFHVSKVRLSEPIKVGTRVYFNSTRNDKNQLRATEVTSSSLSIGTGNSSVSPKPTKNDGKRNHYNNRHSNRSSQNKGSLSSILFGLIAMITIAVYFLGDFQSTSLDSVSNSTSSTSSVSTAGITGDAQIDDTITLIKQGGPYPYPNKDGTTFYNREGRLPAQPQGYYHEYTVPTPGVSHRGARRIVTGGNPPTVYYLTVDHYNSFRRLDVP